MIQMIAELYAQLNSGDEDLVDAAEAEWERACTRYKRHYKKIKALLPETFRKFHDEYCLHDADIFGPAKLSVQTLPWGFHDVVIVAQNINTLYAEHLNTLMFLQYVMAAEPIIEIPVKSEIFKKTQTSWLYDEINVVQADIFAHEILLSDGRVVKLHFREFRFHVASLLSATAAGNLKQLVQEKAASA